MRKTILQEQQSCSVQKNLEKTPNIREKRQFSKSSKGYSLCKMVSLTEPSCKAYSPCKGYSLCKMVSLGQKLKMSKTCEKPFKKNIRVVLSKKLLEKIINIRKMREIKKKTHLAKPIAHAKAIAFGKWSVWVKN